jgi:hypothetical protein
MDSKVQDEGSETESDVDMEPEYAVGPLPVEKSFRSHQSCHGIPFDEIESALQKAVRRSLPDTARQAAIEMVDMGQRLPTSGRKVMTTLVHRLQVICCEESSVLHAWPVILALGSQRAPEVLISVADALGRTPAIRICSWLRAAYVSLPKEFPELAPKGLEVDEKTAATESDLLKSIATKRDTVRARQLVASVEADFAADNDRLFHWAHRLMVAEDDEGRALQGERRGDTDWSDEGRSKRQKNKTATNKGFHKGAVYLLWAWIFAKARLLSSRLLPVLRVLCTWFGKPRSNKDERFVFLFSALLHLRHHKDIQWKASAVKILSAEQARAMVQQQVQGPPPLFDDAVLQHLDMHTRAGKKLQRGKVFFVQQSARVLLPDPSPCLDRYRPLQQVYEQLASQREAREKKTKEGKKRDHGGDRKESSKRVKLDVDAMLATWRKTTAADAPTSHTAEEARRFIEESVHAQVVTGKSKQVVVMREHEVVKGPFSLTSNNVVQRLQRRFERSQLAQRVGLATVRDTAYATGPDQTLWIHTEALHDRPPNEWKVTETDGGTGSIQPNRVRVVDRASTGVLQAGSMSIDVWSIEVCFV